MNRLLKTLLLIFLGLHLAHAKSPSQSEILQKQAEEQHQFIQQPSEGIVLGESLQNQRIYGCAGSLRAGGPRPDQTTLFEIGSISKVFTGVLLAETVREGKAKYDDPVSKHLPDLKLEKDSPLHDLITLESLSTHHSGLPRLPADLQFGADPQNPYAHYNKDRLYNSMRMIRKADLKTHGKHAYSNLGVGLLGHILEVIWDKPLPELMQEKIFEPLGMEQTIIPTNYSDLPKSVKKSLASGHSAGKRVKHWELGSLLGAGAIVSSAQDLLIFAEAHWNDQTPKGLNTSLHDALSVRKGNQALGWIRSQKDGYSHNGGTGGFQSSLEINLSDKYATVSLQNSSAEKMDVHLSEGNFADLEGYWQGTLDLENDLRLILHFGKEGTIVVFSIDQNGSWTIANRSKISDGLVKIRFGATNSTFEGELSDNSIAGIWDQNGKHPLTFTKIGSETPQQLGKLIQPRIKGDLKHLKGYWSGNIGGPKGLFVILQVLPVGDDLWIVDLYSPTQTPAPIHPSKFSINDNKVTGSWKGLSSNLEVTLEDQQLKGTWFQILPQPILLNWSEQRPATPEGN